MMDVRVVRVPVHRRLVDVIVSVRLGRAGVCLVRMLVVLVVDVAVGMLEHVVLVFVLVVLGEMEPDAASHECARCDQGRTQGLRSRRSEARAPKKGAREKYAPVRAVPRWRSATTKRARLTP